MTTISAVPTVDIEFLQPEDTMELASSPHIQQGDLDLELDTMDEPELAPEDSMEENAFDDDQLNAADHLDDDVMVDEETAAQQFSENASDLNMEVHHEQETAIEDEDILYEDEEALKDSGLGQIANKSISTSIPYNNLQEHLGVISGDAEVFEARAGDGLILSEQDTVHQSAVLPQLQIAAVSEASSLQPAEDPHQEAKSISNGLEAPGDAGNQNGAVAPEDTTKPALDLEQSTVNTNSTDITEAAFDAHPEDYSAVNTANLIVEDATTEQQPFPLDTQNALLQAVKVIYQDSEMCLFPPQNEEGAETFFLSEYRLAYETLDKLLASCREVLADTIGDDDELVLDVASLGLHISEGSKYAAEITLSQVLEVYLKLSHNDGMEQVEPLYCSLSSRVCLASQYAYLAAAAHEGKTITEVIAEHTDSPELEIFEEQEEFQEEPSDQGNTHLDIVDTHVSAPEQSEPEVANNDEEAANVEASDSLEARQADHLDTTGYVDDSQSFDNEEHRDITNSEDPKELKELGPFSGATEKIHSGELGIESHTEYKEDIDEFAHEDHGGTLQEQMPAFEKEDNVGMNDGTASSATVEAEVKDSHEDHYQEDLEHDDDHLEHFGYDDDYPGHVFDEIEAQVGQNIETAETNSSGFALREHEEDHEADLLDLEPEHQEPPSNNQPDSETKVDETGSQDVEDNEDLFDEEDASTDQTLDNTQVEDEDDVNAFLQPATPTKAGSAKRKVVADDEDDFGLLDTETPDKKRRRPS